MASSIIMRAEEVRELAFGTITGSYAAIGNELSSPARMLIIQNFMDADIMLSFDGLTDHIPVKASSSIVLDLSSNKTVDTGFFVEKGTEINVRTLGTPSEGSVYVSSLYGKRK